MKRTRVKIGYGVVGLLIALGTVAVFAGIFTSDARKGEDAIATLRHMQAGLTALQNQVAAQIDATTNDRESHGGKATAGPSTMSQIIYASVLGGLALAPCIAVWMTGAAIPVRSGTGAAKWRAWRISRRPSMPCRARN